VPWSTFDASTMARPGLPRDFSEFLRLLAEHDVDYLVVGGYAVGYHGYPRVTGDIDIWIRSDQENADRVVRVLQAFGFDVPELHAELFLEPGQIVRLGVPPTRIEILTSVSGLTFDEAVSGRVQTDWDDVPVTVIGLTALLRNKKASARPKDLDDLAQLEPPR
jgi:hypothetical protein